MAINDGGELWPALNGFFEGLNFGGVDHLLIEAAKGLIVVNVVCHMINSKCARGRLMLASTVVMSCKVGVLYSLCTTSTSWRADREDMPEACCVLLILRMMPLSIDKVNQLQMDKLNNSVDVLQKPTLNGTLNRTSLKYLKRFETFNVLFNVSFNVPKKCTLNIN